MPGRECYHCKQWIEEGEAHDCWTTTEAALTEDLSDELRDAWERLRESLADLGEQRIYASGSCIMFARDVCYVFVRPKRKVLEICIFLDRALTGPRVRRADRKSKVKFANLVHIQHRDEVEPPLTDWLGEAYALLDRSGGEGGVKDQARRRPKPTTDQGSRASSARAATGELTASGEAGARGQSQAAARAAKRRSVGSRAPKKGAPERQ